RRSRRDGGMALPTPAHHQPAWRIDHLVFPTHDVLTVDVDAVAPAGPCVGLGTDAHPLHEAAAVGEIREYDFGRRLDPLGDLERARVVLNHAPPAGVNGLPLRRARAAGPGHVTTFVVGRLRAGRAPADRLCS